MQQIAPTQPPLVFSEVADNAIDKLRFADKWKRVPFTCEPFASVPMKIRLA
jgi:hypothetical protein